MPDRTGLKPGDRFGLLTVVRFSHRDRHRHPHYLCRCDCGVEKPVYMQALKQGATISCGCSKTRRPITHVRPGERYGRVVVIRFLNRNHLRKSVFECKCDCGKTFPCVGSNLKSGCTRSCGCFKSESVINRVRKGLATGQRYGRLVINAFDHRGKDGRGYQLYYRARCDCGKEVVVSRGDVVSGDTRSCGCLFIERRTKPMAAGEKYGRLTTVSDSYLENGDSFVLCVCECGTQVPMPASRLRNGYLLSCGCLQREAASRNGLAQMRKAGRRCYLYQHASKEIWMRSSWEVAYAHALDRDGVQWEYEPRWFRLNDASSYCPDFYLVDQDVWVDVKGRSTRTFEKKRKQFEASYCLLVVTKIELEQATGMTTTEIEKAFPRDEVTSKRAGKDPRRTPLSRNDGVL